jgi:hypothetical protein
MKQSTKKAEDCISSVQWIHINKFYVLLTAHLDIFI